MKTVIRIIVQNAMGICICNSPILPATADEINAAFSPCLVSVDDFGVALVTIF